MRECTVCQSCFPDSVQTCHDDGSATKPTLPIDPIVNERYELKRRLGSGSVSVVYVATDHTAGTDHAIKIILPEFTGHDASVAQRFLDEGREAFGLRHPNIVSVTESGLINESLPFLVMDFIPGASLKEVLSSHGPMSPAEAFEYISAIGKGLTAAHARGVVHRDLKPRNILIEPDRPVGEAIKVTDFGLSAIKSGKIVRPKEGKLSGVLRSPLYLAPEEWSEEESDARSDIYSLGVILYQMLAGRVPFKGNSIAAVMKSHLMESPPRIIGREISSAVERVVLHALEKDPEKRPVNVESFVGEFRDAIEPRVDFDQTIVISKGGWKRPALDSIPDEPDAPPDFEKTIVLGAPQPEVNESEAEPKVRRWPRALEPILLAAGVVLVIVLIGIGVYFSRMSQ